MKVSQLPRCPDCRNLAAERIEVTSPIEVNGRGALAGCTCRDKDGTTIVGGNFHYIIGDTDTILS